MIGQLKCRHLLIMVKTFAVNFAISDNFALNAKNCQLCVVTEKLGRLNLISPCGVQLHHGSQLPISIEEQTDPHPLNGSSPNHVC